MSMGWNSLRTQNMLFGLLAAALLQAVMHSSWCWVCCFKCFNGILFDGFFSLVGGAFHSSHCQPKVWIASIHWWWFLLLWWKNPKNLSWNWNINLCSPCARTTSPQCFLHKVKKSVHRHVAELVSWSMKCAAAGKWPSVGFAGEAFNPKTIRAQNANKPLASGWRHGGFNAPCMTRSEYLSIYFTCPFRST